MKRKEVDEVKEDGGGARNASEGEKSERGRETVNTGNRKADTGEER